MVLVNEGFGFHGFGVMHGGSWMRWILFGLLFWLLFSRCGCCGKRGCGGTDDVEVDSEEDSEENE